MKIQIRKFKMNAFTACAAKNRPSYCEYDTNMCCFGCEFNEKCTTYAKTNNIKILPCTPSIFDKDEICEFAL